MAQRLIYITAGTAEEARRIGRAIVEERLAACANVLGEVASFYWWEDALQEDTEAVLIAKTRDDLVDRLVARVRELHSYDCPCVVALRIDAGNPEFLAWIDKETA